jgi:oxygen-independent coproporphyrinogen-3 oxidase
VLLIPIHKINACPKHYAASLKNNELPIFKGITLNEDDKICPAVITRLIFHFSLDIKAIENFLGIKFGEYLADAFP